MDPYKVLGVERTDSDEDIKKAYRSLIKKYHPDKYQDNPLEDLAEEKVREINEAYDQIMAERKGGGVAGNSNRSSNPQYMDVRRAIDGGRLDEAERVLGSMGKRDAEWYFLSGMLSVRKGWYDEGIGLIQQAVQMDPRNPEYNDALNRVARRGQGYQTNAYGRGYNQNNDLACQLCQCYICADCCCNCI